MIKVQVYSGLNEKMAKPRYTNTKVSVTFEIIPTIFVEVFREVGEMVGSA
jgi:hypothetical protein